jgi:predicted SprT family Zn-dependent metalloprotease
MELADVRRLGLALIAEHGLDGWRLEFDRARRRAGICRYDRRVIGLSGPLMRLYDEPEVRETILHEIAHALAGARAGHGPRWKAIARRIGSTGARCVDVEAPRVPGAWVGTCASGHSVDLHRSPRRVRSCTQCVPGVFSPDDILEWRFKGEIAPMHPAYVAELAEIDRTKDTLRIITNAVTRVQIGGTVRITARGRFHGVVGTVVKWGRTRYHVKIRGGLVTVPFHYAERA